MKRTLNEKDQNKHNGTGVKTKQNTTSQKGRQA